jgi:hypothetical protein
MVDWKGLRALPAQGLVGEELKSMKRQRYVPDLRGFMRLCEENYRLIVRLFPHWQEAVSASAKWIETDAPIVCLSCQVVERTPYTLLLQFDQYPVIEPWIKALSMQVRLYHDARMAEVVLFQHQRPRLPKQMGGDLAVHVVDEKNQSNYFLHEWLRYCLSKGCLTQACAPHNAPDAWH